MINRWITFAFIGIFSTQVNATVIFDDGGLHTIDAVLIDDVLLENGSDLNVEGFAFIQPTVGEPAIIRSNTSLFGGASTVNVSGNATVMGEILYHHWFNNDSAVIVGDNALIVGQGAYSNGTGRAAVAGMRRVEVSGNAQLFGAHSADDGGSAIDNQDSGALSVSISGGVVNGGNGGDTGGAGIHGRYDVVNVDMSAGAIHGGVGGIRGGHGITVLDPLYGTFSGGEIVGGNGGQTGGNALNSEWEYDLNITGGEFQGGNGGVTGGSAISVMSITSSTATISGGAFDAGSGLFDDGWLLYLIGSGSNLDITGGLFGYENIGNGFGIFGAANVNVYGWDLNIVDGLLTGYLMDSSWIETPVSLALNDFELGTINLFNISSSTGVPEPSTLLLMAAGIAGIGMARRKRIL